VDGRSKRVLILCLLGGVVYAGIGGYLVFGLHMPSYSFLMISLAIGTVLGLVGRARR
jgi:hypothetical protein